MATEGYKKKDIQRSRQRVETGSSVSSKVLDAVETTETIEFGFTAEKITVVTTGGLTANVVPKIGAANANVAIAASGTPSTTTTSNMFASAEITRTAGAGKVIILAK